jgi:hypothetical protein
MLILNSMPFKLRIQTSNEVFMRKAVPYTCIMRLLLLNMIYLKNSNLSSKYRSPIPALTSVIRPFPRKLDHQFEVQSSYGKLKLMIEISTRYLIARNLRYDCDLWLWQWPSLLCLTGSMTHEKDIGLNVTGNPFQMDLAEKLHTYVFWGAEQCLNGPQSVSPTPWPCFGSHRETPRNAKR